MVRARVLRSVIAKYSFAGLTWLTMRAWPVARSISLCERSERADNKLDKTCNDNRINTSPVRAHVARRCLARCREAAAPRAKRAARLLPPHSDIFLNVKMGRNVRQGARAVWANQRNIAVLLAWQADERFAAISGDLLSLQIINFYLTKCLRTLRARYHARMARRAQHLWCSLSYVREANERTTSWITRARLQSSLIRCFSATSGGRARRARRALVRAI